MPFENVNVLYAQRLKNKLIIFNWHSKKCISGQYDNFVCIKISVQFSEKPCPSQNKTYLKNPYDSQQSFNELAKFETSENIHSIYIVYLVHSIIYTILYNDCMYQFVMHVLNTSVGI